MTKEAPPNNLTYNRIGLGSCDSMKAIGNVG